MLIPENIHGKDRQYNGMEKRQNNYQQNTTQKIVNLHKTSGQPGYDSTPNVTLLCNTLW